LKKPPYKAYRKRDEEEKLPVELPDKIDTPQAEQFVLDVYKLLHWLSEHRKKVLGVVLVVLLFAGVFGGYRWYKLSVEEKAAKLVDAGLFYLEEGKREEALSLFEKAVKEYPAAPSSKVASFLLGKLKDNPDYYVGFINDKDYLLSPPSKTSFAAVSIDKKDLKGAEAVLSKVERGRDWSYPEALYYRILIEIMKGNDSEALNALDVLKGDYPNSGLSALAEELLK